MQIMHISHRKLNPRTYDNRISHRSTEDVTSTVTPHIYSDLASFKRVPRKDNTYVEQKFKTPAIPKGQSQSQNNVLTSGIEQKTYLEYDLYSNAGATATHSDDMYNHMKDRVEDKTNTVYSQTSGNDEYDHLRR